MLSVLITGSTDGIGKQAAFELARRGYKVIIHGRDIGRVNSVVSATKREYSNKNIFIFWHSIITKQEYSQYSQQFLICHAGSTSPFFSIISYFYFYFP